MEAWDDESEAIIYSLPWKKPLIPQQQGSTKCTYYMMLKLLQYLEALWKGPNVILHGGKWSITKDVEELQGVVYKIIEDAVSIKWKKEFADRNEIMYERLR